MIVLMSNLDHARIGQIAVHCKDVARAKAFYTGTLGIRHLFDAGPGLSFLQCGDVRLMLTKPETAELDHPGSLIYYFVSDIDGVHRDLSDQGVAFLEAPHLIAKMPDHDLWLAAFHDSEGNMVGIMEEKRA